MTPPGGSTRPSGPLSMGTEPHAATMTKRKSGEPFISEPVGEKAHEAPADELTERVLAVLDVEQIEGHRAHFGGVAPEPVTDPRVEQRVGVEMKRLVDDAL